MIRLLADKRARILNMLVAGMFMRSVSRVADVSDQHHHNGVPQDSYNDMLSQQCVCSVHNRLLPAIRYDYGISSRTETARLKMDKWTLF